MAKRWTSLPPELRLQILEAVAKSYEHRLSTPFRRASYATVCREWQAFFEAENFRYLVLNPKRVHELDARGIVAGRNRRRIDYIAVYGLWWSWRSMVVMSATNLRRRKPFRGKPPFAFDRIHV